MPAAKKSATKTDVESTSTTTTKDTKTTKSKTTKDNAKSTTAASKVTETEKQKVETPTNIAAAQVENVIVTTEYENISETFASFITKFQSIMSSLSALKTEFKVLEKKTTKQF